MTFLPYGRLLIKVISLYHLQDGAPFMVYNCEIER
jgi:hypothetical protein